MVRRIAGVVVDVDLNELEDRGPLVLAGTAWCRADLALREVLMANGISGEQAAALGEAFSIRYGSLLVDPATSDEQVRARLAEFE